MADPPTASDAAPLAPLHQPPLNATPLEAAPLAAGVQQAALPAAAAAAAQAEPDAAAVDRVADSPATPELPAEAGRRCIRVVVFSDVVDSTGQMFRDEHQAVQLIERDLSCFAAMIHAQNGRLIKFTGDGVLATFETTTAALGFIAAAVRQLQHQPAPSLQHRFGMHLGEIYIQGQDILGRGVHLAARLQGISPADGVAFTEATFANVDPRFRQVAIALGPREIKGVQGRIACYAIPRRALLDAGQPSQLRPSLRRRYGRRLAGSQRRQAIAAGLLLLLAVCSDLDPANPISTYLLDRRLALQQAWRHGTGQPGPTPPTAAVVLLPQQPQPIARALLADLLERLTPDRYPAVALDYVLDRVGPDPQALARLVRLIRSQRRPRLVVGYFGAESAADQAGRRSLPLPALRQAGVQARNLSIGTAAGPGPIQPLPLQLLQPIGPRHFAAAIASGLPSTPGTGSVPQLPAESVLDWSIAWEQRIEVISPDALAGASRRQGDPPVVVVGSLSGSRQADPDLFRTPAAFRRPDPIWGGNVEEMPGVILQTVVAQSLALGHWLTPLASSGCTALAGGLGVLLAAGVPRRPQRLMLLLLLFPLGGLLSLQAAVGLRLLSPILLPSLALGLTSLLRRQA